MWFRASRDPFQGARATTDQIEWVEHLLWVLSKFVDHGFGSDIPTKWHPTSTCSVSTSTDRGPTRRRMAAVYFR